MNIFRSVDRQAPSLSVAWFGRVRVVRPHDSRIWGAGNATPRPNPPPAHFAPAGLPKPAAAAPKTRPITRPPPRRAPRSTPDGSRCSVGRSFSVPWTYEVSGNAAVMLSDLGPSAEAKVREYLEKRIRGSADPRAFGKPLRGRLHGLWRYRVEDYRLLCRRWRWAGRPAPHPGRVRSPDQGESQGVWALVSRVWRRRATRQ